MVDTGWYAAAADNAETPWLDDDIDEVEGWRRRHPDRHPLLRRPRHLRRRDHPLPRAGDVARDRGRPQARPARSTSRTSPHELNEAMTDSGQARHSSRSRRAAYTRNNAGLLGFELLAQVYKLGRGRRAPAGRRRRRQREHRPAVLPRGVPLGRLRGRARRGHVRLGLHQLRRVGRRLRARHASWSTRSRPAPTRARSPTRRRARCAASPGWPSGAEPRSPRRS